MKIFLSILMIMLISSWVNGQEEIEFPNGDQIEIGQIINLGNLNFLPDSASLTDPGSLLVLEGLFHFLGDNPSMFVEIGGHTSSGPGGSISLPYSYVLSRQRAESVGLHLINRGIQPQRIHYKGYGPEKPIASNATAEGKYANQRVEIMIMKKVE